MIKWPLKKLSEVAETTSGGTPLRSKSSYFGGNIAWVKSGELEDTYIYDSDEKISEEGLKNSSAKIFPKNTLLVAMYGATVGRLGILKVPAATNQAVCGVTPSNLIDVKFLFLLLLNKRKELIYRSGGGAQPNISQSIIKNLEIPVPPLIEQKRIVAKLEKILNQIDHVKKLKTEQLADLESLKTSILNEAFQGEF